MLVPVPSHITIVIIIFIVITIVITIIITIIVVTITTVGHPASGPSTVRNGALQK